MLSLFSQMKLYTLLLRLYHLLISTLCSKKKKSTHTYCPTHDVHNTIYRIGHKLDTNIRSIDHFCLFFSFPFQNCQSIISYWFSGVQSTVYVVQYGEQHIRFDYLDNVFTIYRLIKTNLYFLSLNENVVDHYSGICRNVLGCYMLHSNIIK